MLQHRELLAGNALNSSAHGFIFNEYAVLVFKEVLYIHGVGRAVGNFVSILRHERQIAVVSRIALGYVLEYVIVGEVDRITDVVHRAALVASNLPAEEYLAFGGSGHAVADNSCGVVHNIVGAIVNHFTQATIQVVLHTIGSLFAGDFHELENNP